MARNVALVVVSIIGMIALLDVAACLAVNGSVNFSPLLALVVAVAGIVHLVKGRSVQAVQTEDVITLLRLHLHAAALARHTAVLNRQERGLGVG